MTTKIIKGFPILYLHNKLTTRFWKLFIIEKNKNIYLKREYGVIHTNKKTVSISIIQKSKIKSALDIAITRANLLWKNKQKTGFSTTSGNHTSTEIKQKHSVIRPMSAHKLDDYMHKITYPVYVQKKLDGFRCLSTFNKKTKQIELYTKSMNSFEHLPELKKELAKIKLLLSTNKQIYLDGELYNHDLDFHKISSILRKKHVTKENIENMKLIKYCIFDMFDINDMNMSFQKRYEILEKIFQKHSFKYIELVKCDIANSYNNIEKLNTNYLLEGFEGVIVRNPIGLYKLNSRSSDVLRTKEFKKGLFVIKNAKKDINNCIVWILSCNKNTNKSKKTFSAMQMGTSQFRKELYKKFQKNPEEYIGKKAVVKYLMINNEGCVIRNPIVETLADKTNN